MNSPGQLKERKLANNAIAQSTKKPSAPTTAGVQSAFEQKMHERNITHSDW